MTSLWEKCKKKVLESSGKHQGSSSGRLHSRLNVCAHRRSALLSITRLMIMRTFPSLTVTKYPNGDPVKTNMWHWLMSWFIKLSSLSQSSAVMLSNQNGARIISWPHIPSWSQLYKIIIECRLHTTHQPNCMIAYAYTYCKWLKENFLFFKY